MSKKNSKAKEKKIMEEKWGKDVIEVYNWTAFPNLLLERQQALKLDPVQMNILLVLLKRWWLSDNMPFPGRKEIANTIGRDVSTVTRQLKNMEDNGLIVRESQFKNGGQISNKYNLQGLLDKLDFFAQEEKKEQKNAKEETERKRRGHIGKSKS